MNPIDQDIPLDRYGCGWIDLAKQHRENGKAGKTYEKLIGKAIEPHVVIAFDRTGRKHRLAPAAHVAAELKKLGIVKHVETSSNGRGPKSDAQKKEEAKRREEGRIRSVVVRAKLAAIAGAAETVLADSLARPAAADAEGELAGLLRAIAYDRIGSGWSSAVEEIAGRRGFKFKGVTEGRKKLEMVIEQEDAVGVFGLLAELICHSEAAGGFGQRWKVSAMELLDLDPKAIEKKAKEADAAARKEMAGEKKKVGAR